MCALPKPRPRFPQDKRTEGVRTLTASAFYHAASLLHEPQWILAKSPLLSVHNDAKIVHVCVPARTWTFLRLVARTVSWGLITHALASTEPSRLRCVSMCVFVEIFNVLPTARRDTVGERDLKVTIWFAEVLVCVFYSIQLISLCQQNETIFY